MSRLSITHCICILFFCILSLCSCLNVVPVKTYRSTQHESLVKRSVSLTMGNGNVFPCLGLYYANISIGTPPQHVSLQIDTGSSDLWMFGPRSCDDTTSVCWGGDYDMTKSTTAQDFENAPPFEIQYETPNSGVQGFYLQDNVIIGSATVTGLTIAEATAASYVSNGIMGIDYDNDESLVGNDGDQPYANVIDAMVIQGLINRRAYSLWLDDLQESTGTILFGGYDTDKYLGDLVPLALLEDPETGVIDSFDVPVSGISITDSSGAVQAVTSTKIPFAATLDSGTTLTILPADIFNQLVEVFPTTQVTTDDGSSIWLVDCDLGQTEGTLNYQFGGEGGPIISVPFSELAIPLLNFTTQKQEVDDNGTPLCEFGLDSDASGLSILFGDTTLRSAYVVYDLDGDQVYLAQTNFDSKTSNIVEIAADGTAGTNGSSSASSSTSVPAVSGAQSTYAASHISGVSGSIVKTAPGAGASLSSAGLSSVAAPSLSEINTAALSGSALQTTSLASHTFNFPSAAGGSSASTTSASAAAGSSASSGSGTKSGVASIRLSSIWGQWDTMLLAIVATAAMVLGLVFV